MTNLYKTLKKGALITMLGAMSFSAAHAQSKSGNTQACEKTVPADTATAQALKNQLHIQYESIANVLKTLIQTINSHEINRKSNTYKNMVKMADTLMMIIQNRPTVMDAAKKLTGEKNASQSQTDQVTSQKYPMQIQVKRVLPKGR